MLSLGRIIFILLLAYLFLDYVFPGPFYRWLKKNGYVWWDALITAGLSFITLFGLVWFIVDLYLDGWFPVFHELIDHELKMRSK